MAGPLCIEEGCDQIGVFPASRPGPGDTTREGLACFEHDDDGAPPPAPEPIEDEAPTFHMDVTAGLAAMILEHTAMTMLEADDATTAAMSSMVEATGLTADVVSGILLATSYIAAAGEVDEAALMHGAELYEREADVEVADEVEDDRDVEVADALATADEITAALDDDQGDGGGGVTVDADTEVSDGTLSSESTTEEGA